MRPERQSLIMILVNALVLVVVWVSLARGYRPHRTPPHWFLIIEVAILGLNFLATYTAGIVTILAAPFTEYEPTPDSYMARWEEHRGSSGTMKNIQNWLSLRGVVWLSAFGGYFAIWDVIAKTGGGIESPFIPLLVAPALLGPFVVMEEVSLLVLAGTATVWILYSVLTAPARTPKPSPRLDHPSPWVYAAVSLVLVLSAAFIRYFREKPLRGRRRRADAEPEQA